MGGDPEGPGVGSSSSYQGRGGRDIRGSSGLARDKSDS